MKYENFNEAVKTVNIIKKNEELLEQLNSPRITIRIEQSEGYGFIQTIGAWGTCEHDFSAFAKEMIEKMKNNLIERIEIHKAYLEQL